MRWAVISSLLLTASLAAAGSYADLKQKLDSVDSDSEVIRIVREDPTASRQTDIKANLDRSDVDTGSIAETLRTQVDLAAMAEGRNQSPPGETEKAKEIKKSPFYRDLGIDQKRNWLADAIERLRNIHLKRDEPQMNIPGGGIFGPFVVVLMWCLLGAGVIALVYFAVRHIRWQGKLTRKAKALLEDDEPDRTLDEWLKLADEHAGAGRHREAVRALYLACLLKFDEADVARFERSETNWEHLARIEESGKLPEGLDFRTPTRRFDIIWYGHRVDGMVDVQQFRDWYKQVVEALRKIPA